MARLLRLHLSRVGHKDARFFPLTLDFRSRDGHATDSVVWLMNGGGKSSLMNLFYSTFLPESREFLGTKGESRKRKLADYIKGGDLAVVVSEWQMPTGANLFSTTRIVGQVMSWKGGVGTPDDESRLDREFFTFRGSERVPFESLPLHGLHPQPLTTLAKVKDWLAQLGSEYPALEVERGDQGNKGKWRQTLDRVGIDTELFNYHLKMNIREGGAAELFKVRDTMEFIDLFLAMALNPDQANQTREQIEGVREKLLQLPMRELEERFALALLEQLRPLAREAATGTAAEFALREQRRANSSLRSAIESSISETRTRLDRTTKALGDLQEERGEALRGKLARQEYRLNYNNLARELTYREAKRTVETTQQQLGEALLAKNLAAAAIRFARIASHQLKYDELNRMREAELVEEKPVLVELHTLGASYAAALGVDMVRIAKLIEGANAALATDSEHHTQAVNHLNSLREQRTRTNAELEAIRRNLAQRDKRRALLRDEGQLLHDEKATAALVRWQEDQERGETAIAAAETRAAEIEEKLEELTGQIDRLSERRRERDEDASAKDRAWQRGDAVARALRERIPIREVLVTDVPDLNFPDLLPLLRSRQHHLEEEVIQNRLDRADDERTLHSFDLERLFPPSREVELVVAHLRERGLKTALPAYRFLATNATLNGTARVWLANEPARFSGVVVTSEEEFAELQAGAFAVPGLRHPVQVTLSANPDDGSLKNEVTVALPASDGAFNYETAARDHRDVESRVEKATERITAINTRKQETVDAIQELSAWRAEFGNGSLDRLAADRDQIREDVAHWDKQLGEMRETGTSLRTERALKLSDVKGLRPQVIALMQHQERLRSYIQEYEEHEETWLKERREKIALVEQLGGEISAQEREVDRLAGEVESRKERIRALKEERQERGCQQEAIRFKSAPPPPKPSPLDTAETRYQNSIAVYDDRFGRSELDGQMKQAGAHLSEIREEHRKLSGDLPTGEIEAAASHPDLTGQQTEADRQHLKAHSFHDAAILALAKAESDRPDVPAHKQGLGLPPGAPVPPTAAEAIVCRDQLDATLRLDDERLDNLDEFIAIKEREQMALQGSINARTPHLTTLEDLTELAQHPVPSLPTDDAVIGELVTQAKRQTRTLTVAHEAARKVVDERIDQLQRISRRPEFSSMPAVARDRLAGLPREELLQRCEEFIQSHEAWQKVLRNEIETLEKDKDLVVRALDGVGTSAVRLLDKAARASIMPDAFPGWTGQPFLRITSQPVTEPAARRDRLAALVSRLVSENAIPTGPALASAALREIGGSIRATLLKPEDPLRPDRHDITEFGTFSGGEKMTAAVLLYVTLAQLRIRGRDEHTREREAGVLLLDNPFGTASKREFVELQLRVARQMGVQLIYTTGVNDLGALDVLPRILRLRKRHRDRRSGDLLLSQQPPEEHVEGVQANLRK